MRSPFLPLFLLVFANFGLSIPILAASTPRVSSESLHSLLQNGTEDFENGRFSDAADRFAQIERDFGTESELKDPDFLIRFLPIKGHAEFAAGRPAAAAESLTRFIESFPQNSQRANSLYLLAIALKQSQQPEKALERLEQFISEFQKHPLKNLAFSEQIELLLSLDRLDFAADLFNQISTENSEDPISDRIRIQIARRFSKKGPKTAAKILLSPDWKPQKSPEIVSVSMLAIELGDRLQESNNFTTALQLYRLALPPDRLIPKLAEKSAQLSKQLEKGITAHPFLHQENEKLLHRIGSQTEQIRKADDYTHALLLRRGQMFLLTDRPHEAWLLFEQLALDDRVSKPLRQEAHYRWTMAASAIEQWEEALTIARYFLQLYPDSPLAPETLSLIAQAHQEQRRYQEAIEILEDLREKFPDHNLAQRWSFTLGFNKTALERYPEARTDFSKLKTDFPDGRLTPNAELWHALTFFFERDYTTALDAFEQLASHADHPLKGEIEYRRAATLYAMHDHENAAEKTENFLREFPQHLRFGEALVLHGDILMGAARLDEAMAAFESIPPEMEHLHLYGLFQRGKILRAQQKLEEMIELFSAFLDKKPEPPPRASEALYWIGWAYNQQGNPEKTVSHLLKALETFGNDPAAREISSILNLLAPLQSHLDPADFSSWLEQERTKALEAENLTWFSRLTFELSNLAKRNRQPNQAENFLFEITAQVSPQNLDSKILGEIGRFLAEKRLQNAERYLLQLSETFPDSPDRAFAFHGLGLLAFQNEDFETALRWFRLFQKETPGHELAAEVFQLTGRTYLALEKPKKAAKQFEQILELRSLRGRPHAEALAGLAEAAQLADDPARAIAYHQRIYTMHRAQADLTAAAYAESSRLFEKLGDLTAAHRTLVELLSIDELAGFEPTIQAREMEKQLAAKLEKTISPKDPQ